MSNRNDSVEGSGCCAPGSCCGGQQKPIQTEGLTRREFMARTGAASMALVLSGLPRWAAGSGEVRMSEHLIPADKDLPAGWVSSLTEKGEPGIYSVQSARTIGMPVGGIGAGQLYLCSDGTLGLWEIFNEHVEHPHGATAYARRSIPKPVRHGIALHWVDNGTAAARMLDETGFAEVSFMNTHPIGVVSYADPGCPLKVTLEGFSPWIPLNAKDSGMPATLMVVTVENTTDRPIEVGTVSWLENPIARSAQANGFKATRTNRVSEVDGGGWISHSAKAVAEEAPAAPREAVVFQDFEAETFGDWRTEGTAFGDAPTTGNLPTQDNVRDFEGQGFAGSFRERDATTGKLISPPFTISRRFINFKIGGGDHAGKVGMLLVVDGKTERTATGRKEEPLKWQNWDVRDLEGREAHLEIIDQHTGGWGHTQVDQIEFSDERKSDVAPLSFVESPNTGTMAWGVSGAVADEAQTAELLKLLGEEGADLHTERELADYPATESRTSAIATRAMVVQPGQKKTFNHVLTWHFPNTIRPNREAGHYYASLFEDAEAVLKYVADNGERLARDTRKWRDAYYDSTLPWWLLERIHLTACCLATGTTMWWESGRFWAYEGVVCCVGTCTHVYNYVQTVARLFPELERNLRERQDLAPGVGLEPSGLVGFRHDGKYAADGQCGTVLKVYREHRMSADDSFLRRNWEATKKVLEYSISRDGNADGIMEDSQHNTYDVDFHGPNTFVGALYLAALRAGEEMALEMGEADYAKRLRWIYERGRAYSEEKLWNGEYFFQDVDLQEHPRHQYGPGCLSDQLFGQNWAHQVQLGHIYDPAKVRTALESVWKYNWAPDLGHYNAVFPAQRVFAEAQEAGLFNCTWPKSEHLDEGVLYRDEVWTGVEYQVASHMVYEGMSTEALAICRAVHDRYSPERRNPFNEIECSDFYARAMASWGVLLALSGYQYHGPRGYMAFAPRISPENFRCVFNAAEGWGNFEQKDAGAGREWTLAVKHGQVKLRTLELAGDRIGGGGGAGTVSVTLEGGDKAGAVDGVKQSVHEGMLRLELGEELVLREGEVLRVKG